MSEDHRSAAYSDLLSSLLALRADPATARFDAELSAAEAAGTLDGPTARTLAWWQRESLRGVADHLGTVLPDLLTRLAEADAAARASVDASASSWASATAAHLVASVPLMPSPPTPPGPGSGPHLRPVEDLHRVDGPSRPAPGTPPASSGRAGTTPSSGQTSPPTAGLTAAPIRAGFAPADPPPADPPPAAPHSVDASSPAGDGDAPTDAPGAPDPGAPPRRLLVAGLTVLKEPVQQPNDDDPKDDDPNDDDTRDAR